MNIFLVHSNFYFLGLAFLASAFFSASEAAFLSLGRVGESRLQRKNSFLAKTAIYLYKRFNRLIFVILTCNLTANVIATFFAAENFQFFLASIQQEVPFFVSPFSDVFFIVSYTFIVLIFAEFFPKKIAIEFPMFFVLLFAIFLFVIYIFFLPLLKFFEKLVGYKKEISINNLQENFNQISEIDAYNSLAFSHKEMLGYIQQSKKTGALHLTESSLLENMLQYFDVSIKALMIPREKIKGLEYKELKKNNTVEVLKIFPHVNIPIYQKQKDDILGVISKRDFFTKYGDEKIKKEELVASIVMPPILPESKKIVDAFMDICRAECEVALLTDEFGGIEGMVTYEDIVFEIFNKKRKKSEKSLSIRNLGFGHYLITGDVRLNDLNQFFLTSIECANAETLAGYLLEELKYFPKKNDTFSDIFFRYKIQKCDERKIVEVLAIRQKDRQKE